MLKLKRVYEPSSKDDGFRILVERLWPRGLSKEKAGVDLWLKDIAPSPDLRKWFAHDQSKWEEFKRRYWTELSQKENTVELIRKKCEEGTATLVFAKRDEKHNSALALKLFIEKE